MTTDIAPAALPAFFTERMADFPAVLRWAVDKLRHVVEEPLTVEGRQVEVESWVFEGRFARRQARFFQQWDAPEMGRQFTACVAVNGGHYRGQRQTVTIRLTEYRAADRLPLPV